ncbi:MAG TPA: 50S ribosomal protein L11 methyltransferase [Vicinamibacterales bacterium]
MRMRTAVSCLTLSLVLAAAATATAQAPAPAPPAQKPTRSPDVIFVPTPPEVVKAMLELAKVTKDDVVYDLGCGDGGIVVAAARDFGARGVGVDIDPVRVKEANENVQKNKVGDKVKIVQADLFEFDIKPATVVTLYLLPSLNVKLRPILWRDLKVGTRIVSNSFDMGDWKPDQTMDVDGRTIYLWTIKPEHKQQAAKGN